MFKCGVNGGDSGGAVSGLRKEFAMRRLRFTLGCLVLFGTLPSCAGPSASETGVRIGDETLKQFEAGVTTEEWLLAILGEPTSCAVVGGVENTKVLRYASGESSSGLASILSGESSRNKAVTYFIVTNGKVTRFWADRAQQHTLLGSAVEEPSGEKQGKE